MKALTKTCGTLCVVAFISLGAKAHADDQALAKRILDATDVEGGLIVHLSCGDGRLTAALRADDRYLVHGLDADVDKARDHIQSLGLYGQVSVEQWTGRRLPYADNLANLVVSDDLGGIPMGEIMRIVAPGGVAYVKDGGQWAKTVKPRPTEIDEWTHFLYDSSNNAVSNDAAVGPPRHMQWVAGPRSARGHEALGSLSIAVSAGGRVFYIADEGPIASVALPSKWRLIARDAFNGVLLWKKPIPRWEYRLRPFRSGPPGLHRRLVAIGDVVYVTLGYGAALTALDAATGETAQMYAGTQGTEEIVYHDGVLYLVVGDPRDQAAVDAAVRRGEALPAVKRRIMAVNADNGSILWQTADADLPELFALTLAVSDGRVFLQDTEEVVALDAASGKELWRAKWPTDLQRRAWASPTLVVHGDVVITADQAPPTEAGPSKRKQSVAWDVTMAGGGKGGQMVAFSAETGEQLWTSPCRQTYNAPPDVLVTDGLLWTGELIRANEPGITRGLDPVTGKVKRERPADQEFFNAGMGHHRCYRNKATCKYLVLGRSGVEFVDLKTGDAEAHHWVRGTCQHGVVPCNGLLYVPPHTCGCFIKAKLNGFNVLAPAKKRKAESKRQSAEKLERGPAFGHIQHAASNIQNPVSSIQHPDAWPTYRHDPARSGTTQVTVPAELQCSWQVDLGGKLSAAVVAEGKAFIAKVDAHTVHALDAESGEQLWSFVAGGRVDSPPTIYQGTAIFGCADGWVYCLCTADGQLAWRFRAAPGVRRVVSYDQLESAWPVSGSVLVLDGVVYCAAGRSSFLDGGIRLCRLEAASGKLLSETVLSGYDEKTGQQVEEAVRVRGTEMPGALPDVLSSDGRFVFMRHLKFDRDGTEQSDPTPHLFSSVGFLDDTWWHRTYFIWGADFSAGWGGWWRMGNRVPAGRLLVCDDDTIYGFGRSFMPHGNSGQWQIGEVYRYYSAPKEFEPLKPPVAKPVGKKRRRGTAVTGRTLVPYRWSETAEVEARAMVLAGDTLFAAGPLGETHRSLDAFEGKEGIRLRAISTTDGAKLTDCPLDALPVHDGLAAAGGKLYLATKDGKLTCFAGQ